MMQTRTIWRRIVGVAALLLLPAAEVFLLSQPGANAYRVVEIEERGEQKTHYETDTNKFLGKRTFVKTAPPVVGRTQRDEDGSEMVLEASDPDEVAAAQQARRGEHEGFDAARRPARFKALDFSSVLLELSEQMKRSGAVIAVVVIASIIMVIALAIGIYCHFYADQQSAQVYAGGDGEGIVSAATFEGAERDRTSSQRWNDQKWDAGVYYDQYGQPQQWDPKWGDYNQYAPQYWQGKKGAAAGAGGEQQQLMTKGSQMSSTRSGSPGEAFVAGSFNYGATGKTHLSLGAMEAQKATARDSHGSRGTVQPQQKLTVSGSAQDGDVLLQKAEEDEHAEQVVQDSLFASRRTDQPSKKSARSLSRGGTVLTEFTTQSPNASVGTNASVASKTSTKTAEFPVSEKASQFSNVSINVSVTTAPEHDKVKSAKDHPGDQKEKKRKSERQNSLEQEKSAKDSAEEKKEKKRKSERQNSLEPERSGKDSGEEKKEKKRKSERQYSLEPEKSSKDSGEEKKEKKRKSERQHSLEPEKSAKDSGEEKKEKKRKSERQNSLEKEKSSGEEKKEKKRKSERQNSLENKAPAAPAFVQRLSAITASLEKQKREEKKAEHMENASSQKKKKKKLETQSAGTSSLDKKKQAKDHSSDDAASKSMADDAARKSVNIQSMTRESMHGPQSGTFGAASSPRGDAVQTGELAAIMGGSRPRRDPVLSTEQRNLNSGQPKRASIIMSGNNMQSQSRPARESIIQSTGKKTKNRREGSGRGKVRGEGSAIDDGREIKIAAPEIQYSEEPPSGHFGSTSSSSDFEVDNHHRPINRATLGPSHLAALAKAQAKQEPKAKAAPPKSVDASKLPASLAGDVIQSRGQASFAAPTSSGTPTPASSKKTTAATGPLAVKTSSQRRPEGSAKIDAVTSTEDEEEEEEEDNVNGASGSMLSNNQNSKRTIRFTHLSDDSVRDRDGSDFLTVRVSQAHASVRRLMQRSETDGEQEASGKDVADLLLYALHQLLGRDDSLAQTWRGVNNEKVAPAGGSGTTSRPSQARGAMGMLAPENRMMDKATAFAAYLRICEESVQAARDLLQEDAVTDAAAAQQHQVADGDPEAEAVLSSSTSPMHLPLLVRQRHLGWQFAGRLKAVGHTSSLTALVEGVEEVLTGRLSADDLFLLKELLLALADYGDRCTETAYTELLAWVKETYRTFQETYDLARPDSIRLASLTSGSPLYPDMGPTSGKRGAGGSHVLPGAGASIGSNSSWRAALGTCLVAELREMRKLEYLLRGVGFTQYHDRLLTSDSHDYDFFVESYHDPFEALERKIVIALDFEFEYDELVKQGNRASLRSLGNRSNKDRQHRTAGSRTESLSSNAHLSENARRGSGTSSQLGGSSSAFSDPQFSDHPKEKVWTAEEEQRIADSVTKLIVDHFGRAHVEGALLQSQSRRASTVLAGSRIHSPAASLRSEVAAPPSSTGPANFDLHVTEVSTPVTTSRVSLSLPPTTRVSVRREALDRGDASGRSDVSTASFPNQLYPAGTAHTTSSSSKSHRSSFVLSGTTASGVQQQQLTGAERREKFATDYEWMHADLEQRATIPSAMWRAVHVNESTASYRESDHASAGHHIGRTLGRPRSSQVPNTLSGGKTTLLSSKIQSALQSPASFHGGSNNSAIRGFSEPRGGHHDADRLSNGSSHHFGSPRGDSFRVVEYPLPADDAKRQQKSNEDHPDSRKEVVQGGQSADLASRTTWNHGQLLSSGAGLPESRKEVVYGGQSADLQSRTTFELRSGAGGQKLSSRFDEVLLEQAHDQPQSRKEVMYGGQSADLQSRTTWEKGMVLSSAEQHQAGAPVDYGAYPPPASSLPQSRKEVMDGGQSADLASRTTWDLHRGTDGSGGPPTVLPDEAADSNYDYGDNSLMRYLRTFMRPGQKRPEGEATSNASPPMHQGDESGGLDSAEGFASARDEQDDGLFSLTAQDVSTVAASFGSNLNPRMEERDNHALPQILLATPTPATRPGSPASKSASSRKKSGESAGSSPELRAAKNEADLRKAGRTRSVRAGAVEDFSGDLGKRIAWHEEVDVTAYVNDSEKGSLFWNIETLRRSITFEDRVELQKIQEELETSHANERETLKRREELLLAQERAALLSKTREIVRDLNLSREFQQLLDVTEPIGQNVPGADNSSLVRDLEASKTHIQGSAVTSTSSAVVSSPTSTAGAAGAMISSGSGSPRSGAVATTASTSPASIQNYAASDPMDVDTPSPI